MPKTGKEIGTPLSISQSWQKVTLMINSLFLKMELATIALGQLR